LINRLIGASLFTEINAPPYFVSYLPKNPEDIKDLIIDCNAALCRTFFDKNNRKNIWALLESIITIITKSPSETVEDYMQQIPEGKRSNVKSLNEIQLKYFIAKVLEGIK
jgi:hypothetical protein